MKNIIIICLLTLGLAACSTATKKEEKIDFTKSYETAALALTDAQLNYDAAVASKDTARIAAAKIQLETAKTNYLNSKTYYTANGGIVKAEDDQLLAKANTSLGKPVNDTTTVATTAGKFIDSTRVNADKKVKQVIGAIATGESKVKQVSDAVAVGQTTVKNNIVKANEGLKKVNDSTKKRLEEIKKQGNDLLNLFKRKADTTKNN
ncbi:hypothetical protein SAMN04488511_12097 [Pedobacter suwonensis]|uniref:Uncharacterized protein n=1 Tax=Pedobacter suwonensis TaxID=332999 RepID=A0A1I0U4Q1_9SPHI|nr:hypothetical protein [Pedobacter suwonensis]SFA58903.1 hypothetical protein SAMN04488511_12097 [Pedobacter suwonensis]